MKKIISTLLVLSFLVGSAQMKFGVKTGLNVSSLYGDMSSSDSRAGMYAGIYLRMPLSERISIQPEVLFSMQGAETNDDDWNGHWWYRRNYKEKYELNYINIPVMVQYQIIRGLRVEMGPQFSFAVSKKHKLRYWGYDEGYDVRTQDEDLKTFDVGLNTGVNYELPNGLNFTARYSVGFINVNDSDSYYNYDYDIRNQVFSVGAGFSF